MGARMTKNLVSQSLFRAVAAKRPPAGLIHHSDRGSQYFSHEYRQLLDQFNTRTSMSGKGNCFDNAPMESFWGTLKTELVFHRKYETRRKLCMRLQNILRFSTTVKGRQEKLGYHSPAAFEKNIQNAISCVTDSVSIIDD